MKTTTIQLSELAKTAQEELSKVQIGVISKITETIEIREGSHAVVVEGTITFETDEALEDVPNEIYHIIRRLWTGGTVNFTKVLRSISTMEEIIL